jgi:predicted DNA-binding antitoxin AbrB/MazE fold protein
MATLAPVCYNARMRSVEAKYEQGTLKLAQPLPLTPGERVRVIVVRQPDPRRWDFAKLRGVDASEDLALAGAGLSDWDHAIDSDGEGSG